jgi:hypothetical protein
MLSEGRGLLLATSGDFPWPPAGTSSGHQWGLSHGHGHRGMGGKWDGEEGGGPGRPTEGPGTGRRERGGAWRHRVGQALLAQPNQGLGGVGGPTARICDWGDGLRPRWVLNLITTTPRQDRRCLR